EENYIWIMLHTGSRYIGLRIASLWLDRAKEECQRWHVPLPDPELAYLPIDGWGEQYFRDLQWAQKYAWTNRELMMHACLSDVCYAARKEPVTAIAEQVHCHHNYAAWENHFGKNIIVTRKGAVRARLGEAGIIPGSMGASSYVTQGLGNPQSFNSSSHGAGRKMSRSVARKQFTVSDLVQQTDGIECRKDDGILDEIPGSYKDINEVMKNQSDLVTIKHTLRQMIVVKGGGRDE
ncbi:MAG: RtcB family protein, partial [Nitrososphaera sp.]|nr:RtcB family protein [Nitrososphaera sp.]